MTSAPMKNGARNPLSGAARPADAQNGFNEDERAIPSLWEKPKEFIAANKDIIDDGDTRENEDTAHV